MMHLCPVLNTCWNKEFNSGQITNCLVCPPVASVSSNHIQSYTNVGWNQMIKDEKITKKEILANWNMFVGSQATNYGEDLTKRHDEL